MADQRTLRKKSHRAMLWYAADGICAICGNELEPDNWHADHIIPWSYLPETNVQKMQPLCATCNLKKGNKPPMKFRSHQLELTHICDRILSGELIQEIIGDITPGGGKSALPIILAHKLIPAIAEKVCWVVPRDNLRRQGERAFINPKMKDLIRHSNDLQIRASGNDYDPSRGTKGYITTYQSVVEDSRLHYSEFRKNKYILFLDEPHHVRRGGKWEQAINGIVEEAALVVYASGTFNRGDKQPIAFLPYVPAGLNGELIDFGPTNTRAVIHYSRRLALDEGAIVPLHFEISDGQAKWVDKKGIAQSTSSFHDEDADTSDALDAALETGYARELIVKCYKHWTAHKTNVYKKAKMLVVAPKIRVAKKYKKDILDGLHSGKVEIATSAETKEAKAAIKRFVEGESEILITVGMAYEGLDCPEISHIACLTKYRTEQWLEQCFARANRTDEKGGKTTGIIFAPDDPGFTQVIEKIKAEQAQLVYERESPPDDDDDKDKKEKEKLVEIVPIGSGTTAFRASSLTDETWGEVGPSRFQVIEKAAEEAGINFVSTIQLNKFLLAAGLLTAHDSGETQPEVDFSEPLVTPSEQERNLNNSITVLGRSICAKFGLPWDTINKEIVDRFGKSRTIMTPQELSEVWAYLQSRYGDVMNGS